METLAISGDNPPTKYPYGTIAYDERITSMGGKGSTKNAKAIGGIISSSTDQMSLILQLDPAHYPPTAERSLHCPQGAVFFF